MKAGRSALILDKLDRILRDPLKLRVLVGATMMGAWYGLFYTPISGLIQATAGDRALTESHLEAAKAIGELRTEVDKFRSYLPARSDMNEWVEYVLAGVRKFPLKVLKLEPQANRKHGPFNLAVLKLELQGQFEHLDAMLAWIEVNPRLLRIDAIDLTPGRGEADDLILNLTVLGVID